MKRIFLLLVLLSAPGSPSASEAGRLFNPQTGLGLGARSAALGGAFAAVPGDLDSIGFNPAALAFIRYSATALHHESAPGGINREAWVLGLPTRSCGVVAAGFQFSWYDAVERRDDDGNLLGNYRTHREALTLAWAIRLNRRWAFGAAIRQQRLTIAGDDFGALSADLGLLGRLGKGWALGASGMNLGTYQDDAPSAQTWRLGLSRVGSGLGHGPLQGSIDFQAEPHGVNHLCVGFEQTFRGRFQFRVGRSILLEDDLLDGFRDWSAGMGCMAGAWQLDYAFLPEGELGTSHQVSLRRSWGDASKADITPTDTPTGSPTPTLTPTSTPTFTETRVFRKRVVPSPTFTPSPTLTSVVAEGLRIYFSLAAETPIALGEGGSKELEKDLKGLEESVEKTPEDAGTWMALGRAYYRMGRAAEALQCFDQVLRLNPKTPGLKAWLKRNRRLLEPTPVK